MMRVLVLTALAITACGGSAATYSCDQRSANFACLEFSGSAEFITAYKAACTSPAVWAETACPKAAQLGGCRQADGGNGFTT